MVHHVRKGKDIKALVESFPSLSLDASIQPITRTVLRVRLSVTPAFRWNDRIHGNGVEPWWVWVEDTENDHIYHSEYFLLQKKQVLQGEKQVLSFTIPIFEPLPTQYIVKVVSDRWLGAESVTPISFRRLILPEMHLPHTKLLDLHPLPVGRVLKKREYVEHFKFKYFNPIQSQIFHTIYHSDTNVLLGAPTGNTCSLHVNYMLMFPLHLSFFLSLFHLSLLLSLSLSLSLVFVSLSFSPSPSLLPSLSLSPSLPR